MLLTGNELKLLNCPAHSIVTIETRLTPLTSVYQVINICHNKEFLCITHTVEHNYISPSSAVGIQLHVSALYVGHLQVVIKLTEQLYKMCGCSFRVLGVGWGERDLVISIVGTMT